METLEERIDRLITEAKKKDRKKIFEKRKKVVEKILNEQNQSK